MIRIGRFSFAYVLRPYGILCDDLNTRISFGRSFSISCAAVTFVNITANLPGREKFPVHSLFTSRPGDCLTIFSTRTHTRGADCPWGVTIVGTLLHA